MTQSEDHNDIPLGDYVKSRLDNQDMVLKVIAEDIKATRKQATKTNGRVTALETQAAVDEALRVQASADIVGRRFWVNLFAGGAFLVAGTVLGQLANIIHIL